MALPFIPSDAAVLAVQAGVVAAPRRPPELPWLKRLSGPGWAAIPIASIIGVIFAIRYLSSTATALTYLALVAVPLLAAVALGWAAHGSRPWAALLAIPLFALAWGFRTSLVGEGAATLLAALSCVTLGWLLGAVTPPGWLKLGIIAMAAADSWLVLSDLLQAPNNSLITAVPLPGSGLPPLQSELLGWSPWATATCSSPACSARSWLGRVDASGRSPCSPSFWPGCSTCSSSSSASCRPPCPSPWR